MEQNKLIGVVISITVAIICVASIMVPVLNDATTTEKTLTNDGLYRMSLYDTTAEFTAVWDYTNPYVLTVDDESIALPETATYLMTLTGNDGFMVRAGALSSSLGYGMQVFTSSSSGAVLSATQGGQNTMTITVSGGTVSFNNGTSTVSVDYTDDIFFISSDGDYVMKNASGSVYVNGDSMFYGIGTTNLTVGSASTRNTALYIEGSIDDGFTASGVYYTISSTDHVIEYDENSNYVDLYELTGVSFTAVYTNTDDSTDYETSVSYSQIIVPYEVTAELAQHLNSAEIALINVLPVLVIVSIVFMAVGLMAIRRD